MSSSNYGVDFTPKGVVIMDESQIYNGIMQIIIDAFRLKNQNISTAPDTPQGQLATSLAALINDKNIDILSLAANSDVRKANSYYLDALLNGVFNFPRKPAQPTTVSCECILNAGTTLNGIDTATPSQASDTSGNIYAPSESFTAPATGTYTVAFENITPGPTPCPANTLTTILTAVTGWDAINNPADGILGANIETDAAYYARYQNMVAGNASGSINSLQAAVFAVEGVLDCVGVQNPTSSIVTISGYPVPANNYVLSVLGGADQDIALQMLSRISMATQAGNTPVEVTDPISGRKYTMTILRPTALNYFFKIELANQAQLPANIVQLVQQAVFDDFYNNRVRIGSTTFATRFVTAINTVYPSISINSITMASQPEGGTLSPYGPSVVCDLDQYPALNTENINVSFIS